MQTRPFLISILLAVAAGALIIGVYMAGPQGNSEHTPVSHSVDTNAEASVAALQDEFLYSGEEGKTALELLQEKTAVEMNGSGEMAFITSINGRRADDGAREFWSFWVNGEMAQVGAGSYVTKDDDIIEWKIATY